MGWVSTYLGGGDAGMTGYGTPNSLASMGAKIDTIEQWNMGGWSNILTVRRAVISGSATYLWLRFSNATLPESQGCIAVITATTPSGQGRRIVGWADDTTWGDGACWGPAIKIPHGKGIGGGYVNVSYATYDKNDPKNVDRVRAEAKVLRNLASNPFLYGDFLTPK